MANNAEQDFKPGDKVTVRNGSTVWTIDTIAVHGLTAKISSGKRTTMERIADLKRA